MGRRKTGGSYLLPYRILFWFQVLSAKLMPVNQDNFSQAFCEAFVRAGGVGMVLSVLHQDAFSAEIDYNIQRGCYFSALQVLRFLSCGKSVLDSAIQPPADTNQPTDPCRTPLASPAKWPSQASSGKKTTVDFMLPSSSKTGLTPRKVDLQLLILQMTVEELHTLLDAIIRVAWASAVGCLSAVNNNLPPKGGYISETRRQAQGRVDSGSSAGSNGSNDIDMQSLSAKLVDNGFQRLDSLLAIEALEFLVECLEQRKMHGLSYFKALPCVDSFIIDLLVNATSTSVRKTASQGFYHLSQLQQDSASFFLQVLLKSRLPFWVTSSRARGPSRQVLSQCLEYFDLVYRLLCDTKANHTQYDVDTGQMLLEEINWLQAFTTTKSLEETDGQLMAGHFSLIKALLLCNEEKKSTLDINLIEHLLEQYLFPASSFINKKTTRVPFESFQPKCTTNESRRAAYQILVELSRGCLTNMMHITHWLLKRHHRLNNELAKEFEYEPLISGRSSSGLVGLKNAGATCYMNAVLQQMFMQPQLREAVLSVECEKNVDLDTILHQLQNVFAHLNDSQLEYYIPEQFWNSFRLWGTPVNVREQHDAFEFFTHLVDQVDEYLEKKLSTDALFKPFYEGIFSDQKICQGCPHRYVRDESFMALNLPVKSQSLVESLEQFVKGELLSGDNAYFCERCGHKRDTVKRLCIKKLPPVLTIQLKRFGFDFEANRAVKFDYYFKFPWVLDMAPYTVEYLDKKEMGSGRGGELFDANCYQLVGAVVHSGQANAGHYYSFIKDRREKHDPNTWFKFNDTTVEKIDLTDATLEIECFGGNYKAKVSDTSSFYPEDRVRHWNAYMLFYERKDLFLRNPTSTKTPKSGKNRFSFYIEKEKPLHVASKSACLASAKADSLSQLTTLVDHGERRGLFPSRVPPHIQQQVHEENLEFMHNKEIYNKDYMKFILQLCSINAECVQASDKDFEQLMVESIKLGTHFLLNTYLKYKHKDRSVRA